MRTLLACAIVAPLLAFAVGSWFIYESTFAHAQADFMRAAAVAEEQAAKVLESDQIVIGRISDIVGASSDQDILDHEAELHDKLVQLIKGLPQIGAAWIVGPTGRMLVSARIFPVDRNADFSQRPYFKALASGARDIDISVIEEQESHLPFLAVARRRVAAAGRFDGVIAVAVSPDYFLSFYRKLLHGDPDCTASLFRDDGVNLARYPELVPIFMAPGKAELLMSAIKSAPQQGVIVGRSVIDGTMRVIAYRRVQGYPIYSTIAGTRASIVREWAETMMSQLYFAVPAILSLVLLCLVAIRRARSEAQALARAHEAIEQRDVAEMALRQSQRMEALGQLTGGVAHDFNNLLTIILWNIEALKRRLPPELANLARLADSAMEGAHRAVTLVRRLLAFSRRQPLEPKPIDPNRLIVGMADLLQRTLGEAIAVESVLTGGVWRISADTGELESALLNLVINARDAMPEGGKLTIETANAFLDETYAATHAEVTPGQYVMIAVSDTGCGMTPEVAAKAVEPFFTTKEVGQGTGLGLSQVYGFIKQSGGHVHIYSEPGEGTTVKLYLPRLFAADSLAGKRVEAMPAPPLARGEAILVVEDDEAVRASTVEMLRELGYRVLEAADGASALRVLETEPEIKLLFSDIGLPGGVNGRELADEALRRHSRLKVLFTTGYAHSAIVHQGRLDPGVELIVKPFTIAGLSTKLRRVLEGGRETAEAAADATSNFPRRD